MGPFVELSTSGKHFRAFQDEPVVPFADETELRFTAGTVKLMRREWFKLAQEVETFVAFSIGASFPDYVRWRDVSAVGLDPFRWTVVLSGCSHAAALVFNWTHAPSR